MTLSSENKLRHNFGDKSPNKNDAFHDKIIEVFSGIETGHLNNYAFESKNSKNCEFNSIYGGEHWSAFVKDSADYYPLKDEIALIKLIAKDICNNLPSGLTHVDLGPGEELAIQGKTLPFTKNLINPQNFIGVDVNYDFSVKAADIIHRYTGIPSKALKGDFLNENMRLSSDNQALFTLFGGLLSNVGRRHNESSKSKLSQNFQALSRNTKNGDFLAITQDVNQDPNTLLAAYTHKEIAKYVLSVFHKVKRDIKTENFDPYNFEFFSRWNPDENLLSLGARLKKSKRQPMCFKIRDTPFTIKAGQEIPLVNSYKYPISMFLEAAHDNGFISNGLYKNPLYKVAMHLFEYKDAPENQDYKRILRID